MRRLFLTVAIIGAGISCSASYPDAPSDVVPVGFQIYYTSPFGFVTVGRSYSFAAYTLLSDGSYENVTSQSSWSSSDPLVLRPGTTPASFTAVATGPVDVVARYGDFVSSISTYAILPDRQTYPYLLINVGTLPRHGETAQIAARIQQSATVFQTVTTLVAWSSSNPAVVTISPEGRLAAISPGTTQIRASYDGMSAFFGFSVLPRDPRSF